MTREVPVKGVGVGVTACMGLLLVALAFRFNSKYIIWNLNWFCCTQHTRVGRRESMKCATEGTLFSENVPLLRCMYLALLACQVQLSQAIQVSVLVCVCYTREYQIEHYQFQFDY